MSNKRGHAELGFCEIGTRVRLVASSHLEQLTLASDAAIVRRLDLKAAGQTVAAIQYADALETHSVSFSEWRSLALSDFIDTLKLSAEARSTLCRNIVQLLGTTMTLRRDPIFIRQLHTLINADGLTAVKLRFHKMQGDGTVICEVASRLGLVRDAIVVCLSDSVSAGTTLTVETFEPAQRKSLAVVDFGTPPKAETALIVMPDGLARADVAMVESDDIERFVERYHLSLPEIINLSELWNDAHGGVIARVGTVQTRNDTVAVPEFDFRLRVSDIVSTIEGTLVSGWISDPEKILEGVSIVDYSLEVSDILKDAKTAPMAPGTSATGSATTFTSFLRRRTPDRVPTNISIRVKLPRGESRLIYIPSTRAGLQKARRDILSCVSRSSLHHADIVEVFAPALGPVQEALVRRQKIAETVDLGSPSARKAAIIVPLFRQVRYLRSQLMAITADPWMKGNCQVVFVVDDPTIVPLVRKYITGAADVFGLDLRLVTMEHNGGYAVACNSGVTSAASEFIILMNSDVVPLQSGWAAHLAAIHARLPSFSAVGPKLLYADGSIQHAGMYFERSHEGTWQNNHRYKGFGGGLDQANTECDVAALSGALLAFNRSDFIEVGGLDTSYVVGDFEDSDLCLKFKARGGVCRYVPSASLYHFERQSMPSPGVDWSIGATRYNEVLHHKRWASYIDKLNSQTESRNRDMV